MKMLLPTLSLLAALALSPAALADSAALEAELDQKSGQVLAQTQAYRQIVRDVKTSMVMSKSSGPSDVETERLLKAMNGVKDSIGDLLTVLVAHADELRPDDKDFDAFVASLQSRSHDFAEGIAELEHPPVRALPPPSAFMHR